MLSYTATNQAAQKRPQPTSAHTRGARPAKRVKAPEVPWRQSAFQTLQQASSIVGVSVASLYRFEIEKRLIFKRLAGRTLVDTPSLIALVEGAESWTPSTDAAAARAARAAPRG